MPQQDEGVVNIEGDNHPGSPGPEDHTVFVPHNEETIPSSWTPNSDVNGNK